MSKAKSVFACQVCSHHTTKWLGRCPECGGWNTFAEELQAPPRPARQQGVVSAQLPLPLTEIARSGEERLLTGIGELDRVLGGGLVRGSLVLIGGNPGIGKSTLLLQATAGLSHGRTTEQHPVLVEPREASPLHHRSDRRHARGDGDRDGQHVVHQQRRPGHEPRVRPEVLLRHSVRPAAARVRVNGLAVRYVHDREQRDDQVGPYDAAAIFRPHLADATAAQMGEQQKQDGEGRRDELGWKMEIRHPAASGCSGSGTRRRRIRRGCGQRAVQDVVDGQSTLSA